MKEYPNQKVQKKYYKNEITIGELKYKMIIDMKK